MTNTDELIRLLNRGERLEALPRTGWLFAGVTAPESVAAHSYNVTLVVLWLATHLDADVGKAVQMAILHDLAESETTDLPRPIKDKIPGIKALESTLMIEILQGMPDAQRMYQEYEAGVSLEAKIVKAADSIQMIAKACQYHRQNGADVRRFFNPKPTGIVLADAVIARLLERLNDSDWNDLEYGAS
jgi:putative hydrolase of HD superfamily